MTTINSTLTVERLKELFHYDPEIGTFTRKISRGGYIKGSIAGFMTHEYLSIRVDRTIYFLHRLAWLYMTGEWPKNQIDHINRNKTDNRFSNLREATSYQNMQNIIKPPKNNSLGLRGVSKYEKFTGGKDKYKATIMVNKSYIHLGYFDSAEEAYAAYLEAKRKYHPDCII